MCSFIHGISLGHFLDDCHTTEKQPAHLPGSRSMALLNRYHAENTTELPKVQTSGFVFLKCGFSKARASRVGPGFSHFHIMGGKGWRRRLIYDM